MSAENISRTIDQLGKKFFLKIETESTEKENDKIIKIIASDGRSVWESAKGTDWWGLHVGLTLLLYYSILEWID